MHEQQHTIWADNQCTGNILWSTLCYGSVRALRPLFTCCNDNIHVWGLSWAPLKESDMLFAQMCESKAERPIFLYLPLVTPTAGREVFCSCIISPIMGVIRGRGQIWIEGKMERNHSKNPQNCVWITSYTHCSVHNNDLDQLNEIPTWGTCLLMLS